jgi:hypothetical protein
LEARHVRGIAASLSANGALSSDDYALWNWILGFGRFVKVIGPAQLVKWMEDELEAARQQYGVGGVAVDSDVQPPLPFPLLRLANA